MTVLGMLETAYSLLTLLSVSNSIGKVTGVASSHFAAAAESGSTFTPIIVKPIGLYFLCSCSSSGISVRHGPHHVAQKLIITTWPLYWARLTLEPAMAASSKFGAAVGVSASVGRASNVAASAATTR